MPGKPRPNAVLQGAATWQVYGMIPQPLPIYSESLVAIAVFP